MAGGMNPNQYTVYPGTVAASQTSLDLNSIISPMITIMMLGMLFGMMKPMMKMGSD